MSRWIAALCCLLLLGPAQARELKPYAGGATPPLELRGLDGKLHNLKDYRGRVVLVNFFASWCPPCRAEMPSIERLQQRMAGKPFTVLAVDMGESEPAVRAFLKEIHVTFPVLLDKDGAALKRWKVFVFPTSFVVDPEGRIRYALFGSLEWDEPGPVAKITGLLP